MIRVGLIGYGYWGRNLARNLMKLNNVKLVGLSELSAKNCAEFERLYPGIKIYDAQDLTALNDVDAVVIATPPESHYALSMRALQAGKHVFVEKPMAMNSTHCAHMIREAKKRNLTLSVDHTFVFTPAVLRMYHEAKEIGKPLYYDSVRANLGLFQAECDVTWDLAVHDLAIVHHTFPDLKPEWVKCDKYSHYEGQKANLAYLTVGYTNNFTAHISVSWNSPVKIRSTRIVGVKKTLLYNDIEADEKLKIYDRSVELSLSPDAQKVSYRTGDVVSPKLESGEALESSLYSFIACCEKHHSPYVDGDDGLEAVHILEMAGESANQNGKVITL